MIEALRAAFTARDYLQLLAQSLRDPPARSESEHAERQYYRAYACCVFKLRAPGLAPVGAAAIHRAVPFLASSRHPLLVPALINGTGWALRSGNLAGASHLTWQCYHLALEQEHPRLFDAALIALQDARRQNRPKSGRGPFLQLQRILEGRWAGETPPQAGWDFSAAALLARSAATWGEPGLARLWAERAGRLLPGIVQPEQARTGHDCLQTSFEIQQQAWWLQMLIRLRLEEGLVERLRRLRDRIAVLPHLCAGAEFRVWCAVAEAALVHGSLYARNFVIAAGTACRASGHSDPANCADWRELLDRQRDFVPAPIGGELADLLSPDAWRHWPERRAETAVVTPPASPFPFLFSRR